MGDKEADVANRLTSFEELLTEKSKNKQTKGMITEEEKTKRLCGS